MHSAKSRRRFFPGLGLDQRVRGLFHTRRCRDNRGFRSVAAPVLQGSGVLLPCRRRISEGWCLPKAASDGRLDPAVSSSSRATRELELARGGSAWAHLSCWPPISEARFSPQPPSNGQRYSLPAFTGKVARRRSTSRAESISASGSQAWHAPVCGASPLSPDQE
jgi:hypothetical protein